MADMSKAFAEEAFRDIVKIARSSSDAAKLPEMREQAKVRINQFTADVSKLRVVATYQIGSLQRKLKGVLKGRMPSALEKSVLTEALDTLNGDNGLKKKPRR